MNGFALGLGEEQLGNGILKSSLQEKKTSEILGLNLNVNCKVNSEVVNKQTNKHIN